MKNNIKCPYCGKEHYQLLGCISTMCYYPPIIKDGVNVNPDKNTITMRCQCLACNKIFEVQDEE